MIVKRQWLDKKGHSMSSNGLRTYLVIGYFLFGFIPLYVNRTLIHTTNP
jgi:hypothetical protein